MSFKQQFNLNSLIAIGIAFVNVLMFIIGTFLWGTVTSTQGEVKKLNENMATAVANQGHLQRTLEQIIPRGELELRFKSIDVELQALKTRIQQNDIAIRNLRINPAAVMP